MHPVGKTICRECNQLGMHSVENVFDWEYTLLWVAFMSSFNPKSQLLNCDGFQDLNNSEFRESFSVLHVLLIFPRIRNLQICSRWPHFLHSLTMHSQHVFSTCTYSECILIVHSQHALSACNLNMYSQHAFSACILNMHSQSAFPECSLSMHSQRAFSECILSIHFSECILRVHSQHAFSACILSMHSACIPRVHSQNSFPA